MLNFSLKAAPKNPVKFEILDSRDNVVRELEKKESKDLVVGINRVKWDMRYDSPRVIALRTVAPDNSRIWEEPRFRDADSRPITHWGSKPGEVGPIAAAGSLFGTSEGRWAVLYAASHGVERPECAGFDCGYRSFSEDAASDTGRYQHAFRYRQSNRMAAQAN